MSDRLRPIVTLVALSAAGLMVFMWPLLWAPEAGTGHDGDAIIVFALVVPAVLLVTANELTHGGIDVKGLAMLGVLSAVGALVRPLGAGIGGVETVFVLLVLAGRVFGPTFGFLLGSTTLAASALVTAGLGPWLPFQMLAASWVGMGAGLLPAARGRIEIVLLSVYASISALAFGFVMNLWFWPFAVGTDTQLSFEAGASVLDNLGRFAKFSLATSTFAWDLGRAVTTVVGVVVLGPTVLVTLRRASRRARFVDDDVRSPSHRHADTGRVDESGAATA